MEELPRSWYPVPGGLPAEWFLWNDDVHGAPLRIGAPVLAQAHCQAVWGVTTRLLPFGQETTAVATNVQSGVQPFEESTLAAGAEHPGLWAFLNRESERSEIAAIRSTRKDAAVVLSHRPDCDRVYQLSCVATEKGDEQLCSFEGSRQLGTQASANDPGCGEIVVVQGWFAGSGETFTLLQANTTVTDCDAKDLRTSAPLVLITADGRTFVVAREHGYEDESFVVFEVSGNRLERILEVQGGGC